MSASNLFKVGSSDSLVRYLNLTYRPTLTLLLMSDQDRISPYNINMVSTKRSDKIKKNINLGIISLSNTKFSELTP